MHFEITTAIVQLISFALLVALIVIIIKLVNSSKRKE